MELSIKCTVTVRLIKTSRVERDIQVPTFRIGARHYALVPIEGLRSSTWYEYEVYASAELGPIGGMVWPARTVLARPRSTFRTFSDTGHDLEIAYVSCRAARTYDDAGDNQEKDGAGVDALKVYSRQVLADYHFRRVRWPDLVIMMGDQMYADNLSPEMSASLNPLHKKLGLPEGMAITYEEHALLYHEVWNDEDVRWMLSCIPWLAIFDDHEVIDDWNISKEWLAEKEATEWWHEKLESALLAYWVYQGAGNVPPHLWDKDERMRAITPSSQSLSNDVTGRARTLFRQYATRTRKARWSYTYDVGSVRILVGDDRSRRDVAKRLMMDDDEWSWFSTAAKERQFSTLLMVLSLPFLLPQAIHELESSSEASGEFPWALDPTSDIIRLVSGTDLKRTIRETPDLEHWPAFSQSYNRMLDLLEELCGTGAWRKRLVAILSGDVHFSYNMSGTLLRTPSRQFYQLVSSPARNRLKNADAAKILFLATPVGAAAVNVGQAVAMGSGFVSLMPPSIEAIKQKTRLKWDPIQTGRGWIWIGDFVARLRLSATMMQVVYDRADHLGGVNESQSDPYSSRRLMPIASFVRYAT